MHFPNPFAEPGQWFKGSLHTHSSASDGELTPDEVIAWYRQRGGEEGGGAAGRAAAPASTVGPSPRAERSLAVPPGRDLA